MFHNNGLYRWYCQYLQRSPAPCPDSDAESAQLPALLRPADVLLVAGNSSLDRPLKQIGNHHFSRAVLYLGRLHDIADPALRTLINEYQGNQPDTPLILDYTLENGLQIETLDSLDGKRLRLCRAQDLSDNEVVDVLRAAISKLGHGRTPSWRTLLLLTLFPWRWCPARWRGRLFRQWADDGLRALSGSLVAEAFAFVQFPVLPLVKQPAPKPRLLRLQPRAVTAADFDLSPYFQIIKPSFQLEAVPSGIDALPWHGNPGALIPESRRPLTLVGDPPQSGTQGPGKQ